jgi:hypothetical protein
MEILEYSILTSNDEGTLIADVQRHIEKGWQPLGPVQPVCPLIDGTPAPGFYQTVVRYEEADSAELKPTFVRINDELAVNVNAISSFSGTSNGQLVVRLSFEPGTEYGLNSRYSEAFRRVFQNRVAK